MGETTRILSMEPITQPSAGDQPHRDWFAVIGDLDDFIFYGEDGANVSER